MTSKFYAVRGKGVFNTWEATMPHVIGVAGAVHKKFNTKVAAERFARDGQEPSTTQKGIADYVHRSGHRCDQTDLTKYEFIVSSSDSPGPKKFAEGTSCLFHDIGGDHDLVAFTDGSGPRHKKDCAGVGVHFPQRIAEDISMKLPTPGDQTNQRAELYAILEAVRRITKLPTYRRLDTAQERRSTVRVYTDSQYSIDCVNKWVKNWKKCNWKTKNGKSVKHADIIKQLDALKVAHNFELHKVRAHTGGTDPLSVGNHVADRLANDRGEGGVEAQTQTQSSDVEA
jgi:ribonuclease HI